MNSQMVLTMGQEALTLMLMVSAPVLGVVLIMVAIGLADFLLFKVGVIYQDSLAMLIAMKLRDLVAELLQ